MPPWIKEIVNMDQTEHRHSIIALKDSFSDYPNRFLVYWDSEWICWLFPNYPTQEKDDANLTFLKKRLSSDLKVNESLIILEKQVQVVQEKLSARHQENRVYEHTYYSASISDFPLALRDSEFSISGKSYKWMTIAEMKQDPSIQTRNMDVVDVVNKLNI